MTKNRSSAFLAVLLFLIPAFGRANTDNHIGLPPNWIADTLGNRPSTFGP